MAKKKVIRDAYHTMHELYQHRYLLFIRLCLVTGYWASCWKKCPEAPKYFLLYLRLPTGQISYHIPVRFLPMVKKTIRYDQNYQWDGHTSKDVLKRLRGK